MTEGQDEFKKPRKPRAAGNPNEPTKGEKIKKYKSHHFAEKVTKKIKSRVTNRNFRLAFLRKIF